MLPSDSTLPVHHASLAACGTGPWRRCVAALAAAAMLAGPWLPAASAQTTEPLRNPLPAESPRNALPALGDPISEDFGIGAERKLGEQIMREIRRDPDYGDDALLLEYLASLWQPLVERARASGNIDAETDSRFAWEAFLVRDRSVNAFALPGGYVGVHLGLIGMTATRDELASVLAHELSHVTQRHIARGLVNSRRQSLLSAAAMIVGMIAASRSSSGDAANAVIAGSQAAAIQGQLNFSRDMEREADRIGFAVLTGAGYAPTGMATMFELLEQSSRLNDNSAFPYLRSHPLTSERIGEARSKLAGLPAAALGAPRPSDLEHAVARGRARVLMDTRVDALRRWQAEDSERAGTSRSERLSAAVESALASTLLRDWARADTALLRSLALVRGRELPGGGVAEPAAAEGGGRAERAVVFLTAESLLARGAAQAAAQVLEPYAAEGSRPAMLLGARIALAGGSGALASQRRSADALQTWTALRPADAQAWQVLGQTWVQLGQPLRALRADAESRLALGDIVGALDRLRAGQRQSRNAAGTDHIEASVIDARLREVEAQRRALIAEERGTP
jgi:predicted Zn-dependent protease